MNFSTMNNIMTRKWCLLNITVHASLFFINLDEPVWTSYLCEECAGEERACPQRKEGSDRNMYLRIFARGTHH